LIDYKYKFERKTLTEITPIPCAIYKIFPGVWLKTYQRKFLLAWLGKGLRITNYIVNKQLLAQRGVQLTNDIVALPDMSILAYKLSDV
jgi:hypothetical protein